MGKQYFIDFKHEELRGSMTANIKYMKYSSFDWH